MRQSTAFHRRFVNGVPQARGKPVGCEGALEEQNRRTAAEIGSERLLLALLRYGVKFGLPNLSPDDCRAMLERPKDDESPPRSRRRKRDCWSRAQHEAALALRRNGLSYGAIGKVIGRSYSAVSSRLRDYGGVSNL